MNPSSRIWATRSGLYVCMVRTFVTAIHGGSGSHGTASGGAIDQTGDLLYRAKDTVEKLWIEVANSSGDERNAIANHALQSESAQRLKAMVNLAESEDGIPILPNELDRDPWLLNCENGTWDLRTGQLRPHRQSDHITKTLSGCVRPNRPVQAMGSVLGSHSRWKRRANIVHPTSLRFMVDGGTFPSSLFTCSMGQGPTGNRCFWGRCKASWARTTA